MIAKDSGTGKSFGGLANYLENGHRGEKVDRVAWFEADNMDIGSIREAAQVMKVAANENTRVEKPVYHFSINWHQDESGQVDQSLALKIAREALADIGLEDHQALIVAHKDTDHFHVHVVANRVHPETDKAWVGSFSKMKLEESMARLSLEYGFEVVPGYHNAKDLGIEPPQPDVSQPSEALRFEQRKEHPSFNTQVKVELPQVFEGAETWAGLHSSLEDKGYQIQARGRGLVVVDENGHFAKASSIGREFSKASLEGRFGESFAGPGIEAQSLDKESTKAPVPEATATPTPKERLAQDLNGAVEKLEAYDRQAGYVRELFVQRQEVLARTDESHKKFQILQGAKQDVERAMGHVFAEPKEAMKSLAVARRKVGLDAAIKDLSVNPKAYGKLAHGRAERFMSAIVENKMVRDQEHLRRSLKPYQKIAADIEQDSSGFNSDINERFDKVAINELRTAQKELKTMNRVKLERDVLRISEKVKTVEIKQLPHSSKLRGEVIFQKVRDLRADNQDRQWARGEGLQVDAGYKRFPSMPPNLTPEEQNGFGAVKAYAEARYEIEQGAAWMGERTKKAPELFARLRETSEQVLKEGKNAEKHFSRFGVDKRALYASTVSGERRQGAPNGGKDAKRAILPFVRSKGPKIQIRLSTILRLAGIPVPRIPMPRIPRPKLPLSKSRGVDRGLGMELKK